jgi:hypothetical protein
MNMKKAKPKRYPIALNLPRIVALLIVYGRHVVQSMLANAGTWFPDPKPTMADAGKHLDDLATSEAKAKTRAEGAVEARDLAEKVVVDDMVSLKGYVGQIVAANPSEALAIIAAAGMSSKQFRLRHKAALAAMMGAAPQEVLLQAKAVRGRAAYEWQMSSDGGKTWVVIGLSTVANLRVPGLAVGTTYQFRVRTTVKSTASDWSQVISFFVH